MPQEKVKLNDGTEVSITVRMIKSTEAYEVVEKSLSITDMSEEIYDSPLPDGSIEKKSRPVVKGNFSGIVSLSNKAMALCISNFPQKDEIDPDDISRLYQVYAEPVIKKVLRSAFSPK
jgi:predicted DNA-binding antitoxin AbrB/MazE fold protein